MTNAICRDGSKRGDSPTCAFVDNKVARKFKLSSRCSIFTAKMHALTLDLSHSMSCPEEKTVVCTDSVLHYKALNYNKMLDGAGKHVTIILVPGRENI